MYTASVITNVIVLLIIGGVNWFWLIPADVGAGKIISLLLVFLTLLDMLVVPYFRYNRYRYSINEECIDIKEGYLFTKRNIVPIERVQKLQTAKGPIDQIFHIEKLIVTTAGGDVTINYLEEERAENIADNLKKRVNEIVKEQRAEDGK